MRTFGSLFTGIAGIDLAAQAAGFEIAWQVENDDFCNAVLEYHYPDVHRVRDVRDAGKHNLKPVDVIGGGFPCQDVSIAGSGKGVVSGERSSLWREFARCIGEIRPQIALIENVPALVGRGGTTILSDLAGMGYDARWGCISARDAGGDHIRQRLWILAYTEQLRRRFENIPQSAHYEKWNSTAYQQAGNTKRDALITSSDALGDQGPDCQPRMGKYLNGFSSRMVKLARQGESQHRYEPPRQIEKEKRTDWRCCSQVLGNAVVPQVVYPLMVMISAMLDQEALG